MKSPVLYNFQIDLGKNVFTIQFVREWSEFQTLKKIILTAFNYLNIFKGTLKN